MEQVIETLASGMGNSVAWLAENGVLFGIFALMYALSFETTTRTSCGGSPLGAGGC
jgi:hypothetical protein